MAKIKIIQVKGISIATFKVGADDFISLTDIARNKNPNEPKDVVKNWMRSKTTIEFLGLWEQLNNPAFKGVEFDSFMYETIDTVTLDSLKLNNNQLAVKRRQ